MYELVWEGQGVLLGVATHGTMIPTGTEGETEGQILPEDEQFPGEDPSAQNEEFVEPWNTYPQTSSEFFK